MNRELTYITKSKFILKINKEINTRRKGFLKTFHCKRLGQLIRGHCMRDKMCPISEGEVVSYLRC